MKLRSYLKEHREEMRSLNSHFNFCNIVSADNMSLECSVDFEGEYEDSIDFNLLVRIVDFEDNKTLISECINEIVEQFKIKNYSCREIKNNDKWNSVSHNKYASLIGGNREFGGVKLISVYGENCDGSYYSYTD